MHDNIFRINGFWPGAWESVTPGQNQAFQNNSRGTKMENPIKTSENWNKKILFIFLALGISSPLVLAENINIGVLSAHQVQPGGLFEIEFIIQNTGEPATSSGGISIASDDPNIVTLNQVSAENPFSLSGGTGLLESSTITQTVGTQLLPAGEAIREKENLYNEVLDNITNGYFELYDIPIDEVLDEYAEREAELDEVIRQSQVKTKIRLEVPKNYPDGSVVTVLAIISYSLNGVSQTLTKEIQVEVTNNPTVKRAILVIIDAGRPDKYYNYEDSGGGIQTLLENGVKFNDASTIFPSITTASHTSIMTGMFPKQTKIPAFRWYDKDLKNVIDEGKTEENVKFYVLPWDDGMNEYIEDETIYEQLNRKISSFEGLSIFEFVRNGGEYQGATAKMILSMIRIKSGLASISKIKEDSIDLDSEATSLALDNFDSSVDLMAVWLLGTDEISHHAGPLSSETGEVMDNVDRQLQRLIDELPDGVVDETVFVITSDHGQTTVEADDEHSVSRNELEKVLRDAGYSLKECMQNPLSPVLPKVCVNYDLPLTQLYGRDYEGSNAVAVHNAGIAMLYFKHNSAWSGVPSWAEVEDAVLSLDGCEVSFP